MSPAVLYDGGSHRTMTQMYHSVVVESAEEAANEAKSFLRQALDANRNDSSSETEELVGLAGERAGRVDSCVQELFFENAGHTPGLGAWLVEVDLLLTRLPASLQDHFRATRTDAKKTL